MLAVIVPKSRKVRPTVDSAHKDEDRNQTCVWNIWRYTNTWQTKTFMGPGRTI